MPYHQQPRDEEAEGPSHAGLRHSRRFRASHNGGHGESRSGATSPAQRAGAGRGRGFTGTTQPAARQPLQQQLTAQQAQYAGGEGRSAGGSRDDGDHPLHGTASQIYGSPSDGGFASGSRADGYGCGHASLDGGLDGNSVGPAHNELMPHRRRLSTAGGAPSHLALSHGGGGSHAWPHGSAVHGGSIVHGGSAIHGGSAVHGGAGGGHMWPHGSGVHGGGSHLNGAAASHHAEHHHLEHHGGGEVATNSNVVGGGGVGGGGAASNHSPAGGGGQQAASGGAGADDSRASGPGRPGLSVVANGGGDGGWGSEASWGSRRQRDAKRRRTSGEEDVSAPPQQQPRFMAPEPACAQLEMHTSMQTSESISVDAS